VTVSEQIPPSGSTPISGSGSTPRRSSARRRLRADQNGVLIAAGVMAGVGWVLLYQIVINAPPLALYRWLFFICLYLAVTGTVLPFVWLLNRRFGGTVMGSTMLREGMWIGLYAVLISWFQMIRALNSAIAFFLALSFIVIEVFLRVRERSSL
jgi:hypothetical protein